MKIAIGIKTSLWNKIIEDLVANKWRVTNKYNGFDAGIDFDFMILKKDGEEILFGWDNWFEGEMKCDDHRMAEIEKNNDVVFKIGEPENLTKEIIEMNRSK